MCKYGYVRVSSKDQNPERQVESLTEYGICGSNIYVDRISGKHFERPNYKILITLLKKGDVLVVKSIDRLGRNYKEILNQLQISLDRYERFATNGISNSV